MPSNAQRRPFRPYPAYKPSGVDWLGEIPGHWDVLKLKRICAEITDGSHYSPPVQIGGKAYITVRDIENGRVNVEDAARISNEDFLLLEKNRCRPHIGDVLFSKDGTLGKTALVDRDDFVVLSSLAILRPTPRVESKYLMYFIKSKPGLEQIGGWFSGAALRRITLDIIVNLLAILPPLREQKNIVSFLDRETAKIDALVAKKERLVELLEERRTALISRAVTRGLDPNAPLKPSGVPWLGEIPVGWEILPLKRTAHIRYGLGQPPAETADGVPLVRATNVKSGRIIREGLIFIDPNDVPPGRDAFLQKGEIIVVRSGALTGDSAIITEEYDGAVAGYDMVVRINKGDPEFVAWQCLAGHITRLQFNYDKLRAAQPHLNAEELANTLFVLPPTDAQSAIVAFLDRETAKIDDLVAKVREGIEELTEYRTALISAAVTGKIDVREEVAA